MVDPGLYDITGGKMIECWLHQVGRVDVRVHPVVLDKCFVGTDVAVLQEATVPEPPFPFHAAISPSISSTWQLPSVKRSPS